MAKNNTWKILSIPFNGKLKDALQQQHHAAQFIALAGRHLITQRPDDSNTNMQYLVDKELLTGNQLSTGMQIALRLTNLTLCLLDLKANCKNEIQLVGKTKQQVFEELKQMLTDKQIDISGFINEMHYEMPAHPLDKGSVFSINDKKHFQENAFYRHNAEIVINEIAAPFDKAEPVRIWPHHFDTGCYIPLEYNNHGGVTKSIGLGWAIPDNMVNEPYYYLSFWSENRVENLIDLPSPVAGEWIKTGWQGGVLRLSEILEKSSAEKQYQTVKSFFDSCLEILSRRKIILS